MGSTWGKQLKISIFGESHGLGIGIVIDGFPAGYHLDMAEIHAEMKRRAPGQNSFSTPRKEEDQPVIVSGILNDTTTGAPICALIYNTDTRSKDYEYLRTTPRPSHSDYTGQIRYGGHNDIRGGGHFSGRLTAPLVFAGALCKGFLRERKNIEIGSHLYRIGSIVDASFDLTAVNQEQLRSLQNQSIPLMKKELETEIRKVVEEAKKKQDSIGGIVECTIVGTAVGLGSPIFDNAESRLASILYAIPAVKGIEFGLGFDFAGREGSAANDCYVKNDEKIETKTNYNGGISGGITTGMPIVFKVAFKPTPSIGKEQRTLNIQTGEEEILKIQGRHDPCVAMRAPVVVEAAAAIAILDLCLEAYGYDADESQK